MTLPEIIEFIALNKKYVLPREIQIKGKPRQNMSDMTNTPKIILMNRVALLVNTGCAGVQVGKMRMFAHGLQSH